MLEKCAASFPEKIAIIHQDSRITYRELHNMATGFSSFLFSMGLKKGDRVGLLIRKTPEAIISFLGIAASGGIFFSIDYNEPLERIRYILELVMPHFLIVSEEFQPLIRNLGKLQAYSEVIVIGDETKSENLSWYKVLNFQSENFLRPKINENDPLYFNFTSGTTGVPKTTVATHTNIFWNTASSVKALKLTHSDIHLCMFPVFAHPHELFARPLYLGGTFVLLESISPRAILKAISDHGVSSMMAVASIYGAMTRFSDFDNFSISSLKVAESGGMHVNSSLYSRFQDRFQIKIVPVWGSTETNGVALANSVNSPELGSIGRPCPYYETKIIDEKGVDLGPDNIGELLLRGPGVCKDYFKNPKETNKHMKKGWFFTDDLVKMDTNGFYYFIGRKSGMMKVSGMKVFPIEIEDVLSSHPKITEVAVKGVQDRSRGEAPKAFIVPKPRVKIDTSEILRYAEKRLAKYKLPRMIEFLSELPKSPGGKILYSKL